MSRASGCRGLSRATMRVSLKLYADVGLQLVVLAIPASLACRPSSVVLDVAEWRGRKILSADWLRKFEARSQPWPELAGAGRRRSETSSNAPAMSRRVHVP